MRLLLASGTPHLPQLVGGLEVNTHRLALELNARGHMTGVLSKLSLRDLFGARRFLESRARFADVTVDRALGYDVYRSLRPWRDLRGLLLPKTVIIQNGNMIPMGRTFREMGVDSIAYLHGLEFDDSTRGWPQKAADLPFSAYIANSAFTASLFEQRYGIACTVIPPVFRERDFRSDGNGQHVTFINPVQVKGLDIALAVAKLCPSIPFLFVRGWPLSRKAERDLKRAVASLPNVTLIDRTSDMAKIYRQTRILLVPSQWLETWGRVVSEAQFSGIPVLSSDSGGLPESVGPGGILLARETPPDIWAEKLRTLWDDGAVYRQKREAALAHANRQDIRIEFQLERLIAIARQVTA
jgi:glycosyltransferase involved in cell wall biosynthesis